MTYTYALGPGDVVTDSAGNVVGGWRIDVYDARVGGTRVTDLQDLQGNPLPGYLTTDSEGRYRFRRVSETIGILWADDGQDGQRWALVATEVSVAAAGASAAADDAAASAAAAQQEAADAAGSASAAATDAAKVDGAISDLQAYQVQTPTLEELLFSTFIPAYNYQGTLGPTVDGTGAGVSFTALVAPMALRILSLSLCWEYWSIAASDTDYWNVDLLHRHADGTANNVVATRTTQVTGAEANGGVVDRQAWTFSGVDTSTDLFDVDDLIAVTVRPTGTPADMTLGVTVSIRYVAA